MRNLIAIAGLVAVSVVMLAGCVGGGGSIPSVVHASGLPQFSGTYSVEISETNSINGSSPLSGETLIFTATPAPSTGGANTISGEIAFPMSEGQFCVLSLVGAWDQDTHGMVTGQMQIPSSAQSCIGGISVNIPFTAAPAQAGTLFITTSGIFAGTGIGTVQ
jgi:hypothetical protein